MEASARVLAVAARLFFALAVVLLVHGSTRASAVVTLGSSYYVSISNGAKRNEMNTLATWAVAQINKKQGKAYKLVTLLQVQQQLEVPNSYRLRLRLTSTGAGGSAGLTGSVASLQVMDGPSGTLRGGGGRAGKTGSKVEVLEVDVKGQGEGKKVTRIQKLLRA